MIITVLEESIEEAETFEKLNLMKLKLLLEKARAENTRIEKIDDVFVQIQFDSENETFFIYELFCPVCGSDLEEKYFSTLQDAVCYVDKHREMTVYYCSGCLTDLV